MRECVHSQLAQRIARNTAIMHLIAMPLPHNHTLFGGKRMARNTALMQFDCIMVVIYTIVLCTLAQKIQKVTFLLLLYASGQTFLVSSEHCWRCFGIVLTPGC